MTARQYLPGILVGALGGIVISAFSAGPYIYDARLGDAVDAMLFVGLPIGAFIGGIIYGWGFGAGVENSEKR